MTYTLEKRKPPTTIANLFEFLEQSNVGREAAASPHIHEYFEALYCLDGAFDLQIDNQHFALKVGDLALIDPMAVHQSFAATQGLNRYRVFKFVPEALTYAEHPLFELKTILPYLWLGASHIKLYPRAQLEDAGMDRLLTELYREYADRPYGYEIALRVGIGRFFLWVPGTTAWTISLFPTSATMRRSPSSAPCSLWRATARRI